MGVSVGAGSLWRGHHRGQSVTKENETSSMLPMNFPGVCAICKGGDFGFCYSLPSTPHNNINPSVSNCYPAKQNTHFQHNTFLLLNFNQLANQCCLIKVRGLEEESCEVRLTAQENPEWALTLTMLNAVSSLTIYTP